MSGPTSEAWQAVHASKGIYKSVGNALHMFHGSCTALDIGSGIDGWGSTLLAMSLDAKRRVIALFDQHQAMRTGNDSTVRIVRDPVRDLPEVHWINYSFVLSHIDPWVIKPTIDRYRKAFPKAVATVLDYTLRGSDPQSALALLTQTQAESDECKEMGVQAFLEQHTRFTLADLESILRHSGYGKTRTQSLDRAHSRGFALGIPTES